MIDYKALYLKAALRAGFILLCMFAVITVILVICIGLPEWLSRKIARRALADPEPGTTRPGRRCGTRMEQIEWIRFYPLKKRILLLVWLFFAVFSAMAFQVYILAGGGIAGDAKDIGFSLFFCLMTVVTLVPMLRYILCPYHSMPGLNRILSKEEMDSLMTREHFQQVRFSDEDLDRSHPIYRSANWLVAEGTVISKKLAVMAHLEYGYGFKRHGFHRVRLEVYYLNGQKIKIQLGRWPIDSREREKARKLEQFLAEENIRMDALGGMGWKEKLQDRIAGEYGCLPPELESEAEKIMYLLKNDTSEIKQHIL